MTLELSFGLFFLQSNIINWSQWDFSTCMKLFPIKFTQMSYSSCILFVCVT